MQSRLHGAPTLPGVRLTSYLWSGNVLAFVTLVRCGNAESAVAFVEELLKDIFLKQVRAQVENSVFRGLPLLVLTVVSTVLPIRTAGADPIPAASPVPKLLKS